MILFFWLFQVPVSNANGSYPFPLEVHRNTRFLFSSKMGSPAKAIAKSIVRINHLSNGTFLLKGLSLDMHHQACKCGLSDCLCFVCVSVCVTLGFIDLLQVQLLKPGSLAQENFERLANLLEQFAFQTLLRSLFLFLLSTCGMTKFQHYLHFYLLDITTHQMVAAGHTPQSGSCATQ